MASLAKKLGKILRNNRNVVMLEPSKEMLDEMSMHFQNVFVFTDSAPEIKKKNIIYRSGFENFESLPDVSLLYVGGDSVDKLLNCQSLLLKSRNFVMIGTADELGKKIKRLFSSAAYEVTEVSKKWQMWKPSEKEKL
jgi:hypothetical protein